MAARSGARLQLQLQSNSTGDQFSNEFNEFVNTMNWGLDGCSRLRKVTSTVTIKLNWGVIFKII